MSYAISPLIYERFKGIREYNGVNYNGEISAIECNNVELVQTEIGSNTGIKTMEGNSIVYKLPLGYKTLGIFKTNQENIDHLILYGEVEDIDENGEIIKEGRLFFKNNLTGTIETLIEGLTATGECNGITMSSTAYDVFIFTNGVEVRTVCFTDDEGYQLVIDKHNPVKFSQGWISTIDAVDYFGNKLTWLSMTVFNSSLTVATEFGVRGSAQNDIYTWNDNPENEADSWFVNFTKKVTAVQAFTGGLYIFTEDDCSLLTGIPGTANSRLVTSAGVGCYSWTSLVKHDLYLFFYDNNQKNIYYLSATDTTGQIKPAGPVAREIQSYFNNISKFKMYSCVYSNRNEVWCIINDNILIYDYVQQEWTTRQQQEINDLVLFDNVLLTAGYIESNNVVDGAIVKQTEGVVYAENTADDFSGAYFPSIYQTTFINAGSNSNIKKQKTPLLLTLNSNFVNDFFVQLTVDNKVKTSKPVKVARILTGIFGVQDKENDNRSRFGTARYSPENIYSKTVVEISTPQTWYTMGIKIFTTKLGQGFFISSMELKNMKGKTKTKGR